MNARGHYGRPRVGEVTSPFPGLQKGFSALGDAIQHALPQDHSSSAPSANAQAADSLKQALEEMNADVFALSQELIDKRSAIASVGRLPKTFDSFYKNKWSPFYANWQRFYESVRNASLSHATLPVISAQFQAYRSKWIDMRVDARLALEALSPPGVSMLPPPGLPVSPANYPPGPPSEPSPAAPETEHNYVLWAAAGLGAVAILSFAFAARGAT